MGMSGSMMHIGTKCGQPSNPAKKPAEKAGQGINEVFNNYHNKSIEKGEVENANISKFDVLRKEMDTVLSKRMLKKKDKMFKDEVSTVPNLGGK
ncbi:hypothetical protein ACOSQ3_019517 [Xanthoceras sorbifolium]